LAILQIIVDINDSHASLYPKNEVERIRGANYAPFRVCFIQQKLVVSSSTSSDLALSELKVGDVITHINGKSVESIIDSVRIYYPASNEAFRLQKISRDILRSNDKTVHLRYISSGQEREKEQPLVRRIPKIPSQSYEKCYKFLDDHIGYITLASIKYQDIKEIKKLFTDTKGIIVDIRNYPSTYVVRSLGSFFVSKSTPFVKFSKGNPNNPGEFTFFSPLDIPEGDETYKGKLVVLVNEHTISQAEYTAMALRAGNNTVIIGSTTAGADGNVSPIYFPGGSSTNISGIGVYYPDGTPTQRIGIVPDVWIEPTINGIIQKRDEVLEKAVEIINDLFNTKNR